MTLVDQGEQIGVDDVSAAADVDHVRAARES
jgi:hypothetical protein